ncbi:bifunctional N-acetylglucosamine-1-phosphate uridyltransferase/glucosamine-1-phosphate acetyltransferase [Achromatium sp. WMS2]|nr:bifunctional N-acetylglucosamine-1-phosphate uridyltransferase/glucosamine-1-phosphate acetyltransferase [Achromatium sp. WMS2]
MTLGIVILAAGQGTRMKSTLPKVLHPLAGKPILEHVVGTAQTLNPDTTVVVYGHGGQQVLDRVNNPLLQWVEQKQRLGTGHAVQQALPYLQTVDRVLVLYGDVPLITTDTLQRLVDSTTSVPSPLGIITAQLANPSGYGRIVRNTEQNIQKIVEHKDANTAELAINEVNTGIMLVQSSHLSRWLHKLNNDNIQHEYYLTDIVAHAVAENFVITSVQPKYLEEVLGINDRAQLSRLERYFQIRQAKAIMHAGVTLADPARFDVRGTLNVGTDINIDINVLIEGQVTIEDNVTIGPNCILRNCHIGTRSQIQANSIIDSATIGADTRIGPFARIRPGTKLAANAHVGNFVELKNADIGTGSKVNHLSYLGDCTVGNNTNIGAGTITCNYDGANKHQTSIGDNAFIGSNTALVAPVSINNDATIGAGSVITEDAPAAKLTLARTRQTTIDTWQRPEK